MARAYNYLGKHLRTRFGKRVRVATIDAGFTCPNVDGSVTTGGCVFCDNRSFSPNRRLPRTTIYEQIERSLPKLRGRYQAEGFIAYFQAGTNTHAPVEKLRRLYDEALSHPEILGLAIGTRPDSVSDPVLQLLEEYAQRVPVYLELGLQTVHDRSLQWMNRGHDVSCFFDAVERCQGRGLDISVHVILGLPGETYADMMETADVLAGVPLHGVKIHNLYVVAGTPLEKQYLAGQMRTLDREEYIGLVVDFLERTPADRVIHRVMGEAPPEFLVAPRWALDKDPLLIAIDNEFARRATYQGISVSPRHFKRRLTLPLIGP
jgi:radical SAM protein (TIGR01212 family)